MYSITVNALDSVIKEVGKANDRAGNVYLPKEWIGKRVMVVMMADDETKD